MAVSGSLNWSRFPAPPTYFEIVDTFTDYTDLGEWDYSFPVVSNNVAPSVISDVDGGMVQLGGSALLNDYIQLQRIGATVNPWTASLWTNAQTGQFYEFGWWLSVSDLNNAQGLWGLAPTNSNLLGSNPVNGFGFSMNLAGSGAPAQGQFVAWMAAGASAQFSYTVQTDVQASDTNPHFFAIQIQGDQNTPYAGVMTWFIDGKQVAQYASTLANFPQVNLRNSIALGNYTAAAQTMNLYYTAIRGQR